VFPRQGHYAKDPEKLKGLPPADIEIARIADLMTHDFGPICRLNEETDP
jgi:putative hydrolase of the HAD superfamily